MTDASMVVVGDITSADDLDRLAILLDLLGVQDAP